MPKRTDRAERKDVAVKMDMEVVRKAKIVAAFRGVTLAEFLSSTIGAIVDDLLKTEYAKETAKDTVKPKRGRTAE